MRADGFMKALLHGMSLAPPRPLLHLRAARRKRRGVTTTSCLLLFALPPYEEKTEVCCVAVMTPNVV